MKKLFRSIYHTIRSLPDLGLLGSLMLLAANITKTNFRIKPKHYKNSLLVRGGTSDPLIFFSIFILKEYPLKGIEYAKSLNIIDAGANVGYSSVYFAHHFPDAKIIAIEPDKENFDMLIRNTSVYPNIVNLRSALWNSCSDLYITNPNSEKWSHRLGVANSYTKEEIIKSVTIEEIKSLYSFDLIDLLKIDIEGGEKELFAKNYDWLNSVRRIMIEVHRGCWKAVFNAISNQEYDSYLERENLIIEFRNSCSEI